MSTMGLADNFRSNLQAALDALGWSQSELARKSGVHVVAINRFLNGHTAPSVQSLEAIVAAVGMDPSKVFSEPGKKSA